MAANPETAAHAKANRGGGRLLTVQQAADYLGQSYWLVYDLIVAGVLPAVRPPGKRRLLLDKADLDRAIEAWKERA